MATLSTIRASSQSRTIPDFISAFEKTYGCPPTIREIAIGLNLESVAVAEKTVRDLEDEGLLQLQYCQKSVLVIKNRISLDRAKNNLPSRPDTIETADMLTFIRDFAQLNGRWPSYGEIVIGLSLSLFSFVDKYLDVLDNKGLLKQKRHRNKSIVLVPSRDKTKPVNVIDMSVVWSVASRRANEDSDSIIEHKHRALLNQ